jgi:hypothetical protein
MAAWPALKEVRSVLRLQPDANEDPIIQTALSAAIDYGIRRTNHQYDADPNSVSDSAHEACLLDACRIYRRRDSLDGTIWSGDTGRSVGRADPDVERLYSNCGPMVFA